MDYIWIIEINIFCFTLMGILLYSLGRNYDRQIKQRYFMKSIIAGMTSFLCEIVWAMIESHIIHAPSFVNFCVNGLYDIVTILTGYYWLCYVETALGADFIKGRFLRHAAKLPVIIITACVVLSYFNGMLFYIDENNVYRRGDFVLVHVVLCHLFTIITSTHAFVKSIMCKSDFKYVEYKVLAMFLLFPLSIGIIQIVVPNIPSISVGITLAFVFVYIDLQNLLISVDTLSGLNNRNQFFRYLTARIKSENENSRLYLFMLDVNKFKKINDTYGHVEGDAALIRCAEALKKAASTRTSFIGRFGGDEFIAIANLNSDFEAEEFCGRISEALNEICIKDHVQYELSFSIGFAVHTKEMQTIQDFIDAADQKLYKAKAKLKSRGRVC